MRPRRPVIAVLCAAALAFTAAACGPGNDEAGGDAKPTVAASDPSGVGGITIPDELKNKLKEHGFDLDKWKGGAWKNWNKDDWLREANEFVNPIIEDLWDSNRMREAEQPKERPVAAPDLGADKGKTDPTPVPVRASAVKAPYHGSAPASGKVFFDGPEGSMVCSATVVKDPANPGKSNLVWTAGHCVHAGAKGGWYRNIAFVPSYNDAGRPASALEGASREQIAPYGVWWGDWAQTSDQWISTGGPTGGAGAPYDFAVLHVTPEKGATKSLEETVGTALPVSFEAPAVAQIAKITATGYPAAKPYDGQLAYSCADKPGRLSLNATDPVMYRIGCSMTGGSSGGGWVAAGPDGKPALVSNTSIGPATAGWLAGPRLGPEAKGVFRAVSDKFAKQKQ
ncbi:trypsin-like serine peptidase [Streptomyces sp. BI20]|uniref:trypsin-like serine peptidase n=1 Tax=Streptomyces sp. BI20 TaxID=3403460 RepID=UPI003C775D7F